MTVSFAGCVSKPAGQKPKAAGFECLRLLLVKNKRQRITGRPV